MNLIEDSKVGIKFDEGKLRFDLIPIFPLKGLANVYTVGAKKYSDRNWEKGMAFSRIYAALMRHITSYWNGEDFDPIDGQHHLDSVGWCAFALRQLQYTHPEFDDRPQPCLIDVKRECEIKQSKDSEK